MKHKFRMVKGLFEKVFDHKDAIYDVSVCSQISNINNHSRTHYWPCICKDILPQQFVYKHGCVTAPEVNIWFVCLYNGKYADAAPLSKHKIINYIFLKSWHHPPYFILAITHITAYKGKFKCSMSDFNSLNWGGGVCSF